MTQNILKKIHEQILTTANLCGRNSNDIQVVAVSKAQSTEKIKEFLEKNPECFDLGENYFEELCKKKKELLLTKKINWHYLGRLQSRKIPQLAQEVDVLHAVSRVKELESLSRLDLKETLRFYVQLNVSNEDTKGGFMPNDVPLIKETLDRLNLHSRFLGLMAIASPLRTAGALAVENEFSQMRLLRDQFFPEKGLSMGMSDDFLLAVKHGATCLRLGTVLFGGRT